MLPGSVLWRHDSWAHRSSQFLFAIRRNVNTKGDEFSGAATAANISVGHTTASNSGSKPVHAHGNKAEEIKRQLQDQLAGRDGGDGARIKYAPQAAMRFSSQDKRVQGITHGVIGKVHSGVERLRQYCESKASTPSRAHAGLLTDSCATCGDLLVR